jgi:AcrR family transcriptional regulator
MTDPATGERRLGAGGVQRRGEHLRRHIALTAKEVFLEAGYERTSMDAVAARAGTSKRSLYAHFSSKDVLLDAVFDLVRELYLEHLGQPEDYADARRDAVALFCGRFIQLMTWEAQIRACRLAVAESDRLPRLGEAYFTGMFVTSGERLADHLTARWGIPSVDSRRLARDLLTRLAMPAVLRALLKVDETIPGEASPRIDHLGAQVDLAPIRLLVEAELPA